MCSMFSLVAMPHTLLQKERTNVYKRQSQLPWDFLRTQALQLLLREHSEVRVDAPSAVLVLSPLGDVWARQLPSCVSLVELVPLWGS